MSIDDSVIQSTPSDADLFADLRRQIQKEGLLKTQPRYYSMKIGLTVLAWAAGWVVFIAIGPSWWQLAVAVYLAECAAQLAFIFHDAGHMEITRSKKWAHLIGYTLGDLLLGVSFGWWISHHSEHHRNPNHIDLDPDVTRKIAVFTPELIESRRGWKRWVVKHQATIYFPFTSLDTLRLRVASFGAIKSHNVKKPLVESALLITHAILFFGTVFWVLDLGQAITFVIAYHMLAGVRLGMSFAPNHKGMPTVTGIPKSWIERQVVTSRNLTPGLFTDYVYGCLNYQIEHHLFPTMPRNNYKRAQPIVKKYLAQHGLPYTETSVIQSLRDITAVLKRTSEPLRS